MDPFSPRTVGAAYDAVAHDYVREFGDDLGHLPLDRAMLDAARAAAPAGLLAVDLGCGPGSAGAHLVEAGVPVVGVDLSGAMLLEARRGEPRLSLIRADMGELPLGTGSAGVVVAYYSLQHVERRAVGGVLDEVRRVLVPGGVLLVAAHLGEGDIHMTEFLGHEIATLGGALYGHDELVGHVSDAGFTVVLERERDALANEYDSRRLYLLARAEDREDERGE